MVRNYIIKCILTNKLYIFICNRIVETFEALVITGEKNIRIYLNLYGMFLLKNQQNNMQTDAFPMVVNGRTVLPFWLFTLACNLVQVVYVPD